MSVKIDRPIITSFLDDDAYKFFMGAVVFHFFPNAIVTYEFFNRGNIVFPDGFAEELETQLVFLSQIRLTDDETAWLKRFKFFRPTYVDFLRSVAMDRECVKIEQTGGNLSIEITGSWYQKIFWEVKLMAIISELYFKLTDIQMDDEWITRINNKGDKLSAAGCQWSDFGTRRRFSLDVQFQVNYEMRRYKGFLGTSNLSIAKRIGSTPVGTYAHEAVMAMSALVGPIEANKTWMNYWTEYYQGQLAIALPDTFTTDVFLRDFDDRNIRLFDGLRQDSGDPENWMDEKIIPFYKKMGVDLRAKKMIFSDALTDDLFIKLHNKYKGITNPVGGIGTFLTNDVFKQKDKDNGAKPLNMVIKMTSANFGKGDVPVVKLSDNVGKNTGVAGVVVAVKQALGVK